MLQAQQHWIYLSYVLYDLSFLTDTEMKKYWTCLRRKNYWATRCCFFTVITSLEVMVMVRRKKKRAAWKGAEGFTQTSAI
jgi:hypothetical protein